MSTGNKRKLHKEHTNSLTGEPGHKQHTNSVTGEPGRQQHTDPKPHKTHSHIGSSRTHKKRKTETTPREGYCKIKIQCACDGCNSKISPKLAALRKHHRVHHNVTLSKSVLRELYKGKFMEDKK